MGVCVFSFISHESSEIQECLFFYAFFGSKIESLTKCEMKKVEKKRNNGNGVGSLRSEKERDKGEEEVEFILGIFGVCEYREERKRNMKFPT
uniref:Uncharacterized protein n=1 Tax=Solanum tuberosum TaxID=4113 RepID=M0ZKM1_SOLTU